MTNLREAAQMALDALDNSSPKNILIEKAIAQGGDTVEIIRSLLKKHSEVAEALRAALATEQEPVAWMHFLMNGNWTVIPEKESPTDKPLYTAQPQRGWQGLTDEEKETIYQQADEENWHDQTLLEAVEAKLKEKNT